VRTLLALALAAALGSACSQSHGGPTLLVLRLTSVNPARGSSFGGTAVTISGAGFGSTATVTIGGAPATNVAVINSTTISATTPQHPIGGSDVVVTTDGMTATLTGGYTFESPSGGTNTAPTITSVTAQGTRASQPSNMADLNEVINVAAFVVDPETNPETMTYEWTAASGTFIGVGRAVTWRAPASLASTPVDASLTVTVVERYIAPDAQGLPTQREHRISRNFTVRVHNSTKEISDLASEFLTLFSNSAVAPPTVTAGFSTSTCAGSTAQELADVQKNRCLYTINSYFVGTPATQVNFKGSCTIGRGVTARTRAADACSFVSVQWSSTVKPGSLSCPIQDLGPNGEPLAPGTNTSTSGTDMVTAVYEGNRWRLCHSDYLSSSGTPLGTFKK
jgi:hypothetical protein